MVVRLREDKLPPDNATVIIHFGAGEQNNLRDESDCLTTAAFQGRG
jgi:hypothetical protein